VTAGVIASVALVSGQGSQTGSGQPGPAQPADAARQRQLIDQYYVTCHNGRLKTAGLLLDQLDRANLGAHADFGEKVVRKLRAGLMPYRLATLIDRGNCVELV
jgi:hypothetical protein